MSKIQEVRVIVQTSGEKEFSCSRSSAVKVLRQLSNCKELEIVLGAPMRLERPRQGKKMRE